MTPKQSKLLLLLLFVFTITGLQAQQTELKYLSGTGSDATVAWDFYCTKGRNSGKWSKIQVPSCWELQGFGQYDYGKIKLEKQGDEQGLYKYKFKVDKSWQGKKVNIVFEGSMTDTEVKINGKLAGKVHQGAFYRFKYDISPMLKYGTSNLLEVKVSKKSENASVNGAEREADFWIFGGIFRPVYLEALPQTHIEHIAVDARADGKFALQVQAKNVAEGLTISAVIEEAKTGKKLKELSSSYKKADTMATLQEQFNDINFWSPEFPNLYKVTVNLKNNQGKVVHSVREKFGFRTAGLRPKDGFYLNGAKVLFKGVNRHSFWPSSGRTTNKKLSVADVKMMKDMNMNAVRMSHYPPDKHFLEVCDSLGLMVLDELTGWQHKYDDTTASRLVKQLVTRDVNHASIVMWDNGNEGGFNFSVDDDYAKYDPQKRLVIHPWERFRGTDTKHYPTYNYIQNSVLYDDDVYFPTEFLHGLYDGGHGAALDDYWNLMRQHPHGAGGFLWVFADEAVERRDKKDSLDASSNEAPDGIVGPYHEKEGSYYTIKEIWSPVYIGQKYISQEFNGEIEVENRYMFTDLSQCSFSWKIISCGDPASPKGITKTSAAGKAEPISLKPGETGKLKMKLPADWKSGDVLYMTATDPHNKEIYTWSWPIKNAEQTAKKWIKKVDGSTINATEDGNLLVVNTSGIALTFDKNTGYLQKVAKNNAELSLTEGPALAGADQKLESFTHAAEGETYTVKAVYKGKDNSMQAEWTFAPGMPVKLMYSYSQKGPADYLGITFNYPEEKVTGMQWLGRGPYHVWKNRLKGQQFGLWEKSYNNTITGEKEWRYPEFKGNHAQVFWVTIKTKEFPFRVYAESNNLFLQMLKTAGPKGAYNTNTTVRYPEGNLGFMDQIQPIGTKFNKPENLGPQSQMNFQLNYTPVKNTLWFDFR